MGWGPHVCADPPTGWVLWAGLWRSALSDADIAIVVDRFTNGPPATGVTATLAVTLGALTSRARATRVAGHAMRVHPADVTNPSGHAAKVQPPDTTNPSGHARKTP